MEIGMLWYDNDPHTELEIKVVRAATYYTKKYGESPNLCLVHPSTLGENRPFNGNDLELRRSPYIRPHHFWIGQDKEKIG